MPLNLVSLYDLPCPAPSSYSHDRAIGGGGREAGYGEWRDGGTRGLVAASLPLLRTPQPLPAGPAEAPRKGNRTSSGFRNESGKLQGRF